MKKEDEKNAGESDSSKYWSLLMVDVVELQKQASELSQAEAIDLVLKARKNIQITNMLHEVVDLFSDFILNDMTKNKKS